jgi:hypothetical protein
MPLRLNATLRNNIAAAIVSFAGPNAILRIYSGTQPVVGGAAHTETLLAELTCNASAFGGAGLNGTATINAITQDSNANATGVATWFRLFQSNGTTWVADGSVSDPAGAGDIKLSTTSIQLGGTVSLNGTNQIVVGNP